MVVRRKSECEYCGKEISCMGEADTIRIYLNNKMENHYKECPTRISEEREKKLKKILGSE